MRRIPLVSNLNGTVMTFRRRFRWILPTCQVPLAALFGGWGLWLRNQILSHDYLFGSGWNSTARFHVWPWPYKFAVVTNSLEVLGVIERNERDAVNHPIDPTEKVVMSGILKGYNFDIVVDAITGNRVKGR